MNQYKYLYRMILNKKTVNKLTLGLVAILFLTSCLSRKEIAYFQDIDGNEREIKYVDNDVIKVNDLLEIDVINENMEAAKAYNFYAYNGNSNEPQSPLTTKPKYLVDRQGTINFPQLGLIEVAGKSIKEVENIIGILLIKYLKNSFVTVRVVNFKISVLGEVNMPGTYKIPEGRVTILQALGLAGDLKITGKRENVLIIREANGLQETYRVDLTKSDLFDSAYFYLQQNDVVVVEPSKAQITNAGSTRQTQQLIFSSISILLTLILLIGRRN